jgi:predicted Zn-dependent protease with MMP-like domain
MVRSSPAGDSGPHGRAQHGPSRRDRHGRGPRGLLVPAGLPISRSRRETFGQYVLDTVQQLESRWAAQLASVEFAVEDVPPSDPAPWEDCAVPLARLFPATDELAARIVLYRRPIETRVGDRSGLAPMVHEIVVEQVAGMLGIDPAQVDPRLTED